MFVVYDEYISTVTVDLTRSVAMLMHVPQVLPLLLSPSGILPALPRTHITMAEDMLEVVDRESDTLVFRTGKSGLSLEVAGRMHCESIESIEYDVIDGTVVTKGAIGSERGEFQFRPDRQLQEADALRSMALESNIPFEESQSPLPDAVEALLVDDTLKRSRPGVRVLWNRVLNVYGCEEKALAAVARNSALVLPYLNKPFHVDGSWTVLKQMMPEQDAIDVVTKNPGLLTCNPVALKQSDADSIKRTALLVDIVEATPVGVRWAATAGVTGSLVWLIVNGFLNKSGWPM